MPTTLNTITLGFEEDCPLNESPVGVANSATSATAGPFSSTPSHEDHGKSMYICTYINCVFTYINMIHTYTDLRVSFLYLQVY